MKTRFILMVLFSVFLSMLPSYIGATNNTYAPNLSETDLKYFLTNPSLATASHFDLKDSAGNSMYSPSIVQLSDQAFKYVAVYHTPYLVNGGYRYKISISGSNDLIVWNYVGLLVDNADMPKIAPVANSTWLVMTYEQWFGESQSSTQPARVSYRLFYNGSDLINRISRQVWSSPSHVSALNGTPSIYEMHLSFYNNSYSVDGQYGFHFYNGTRDVNAVTTILKMFNTAAGVENYPSTAASYNNSLTAKGVSGNIGQRDTIITTTARYNLQEGNIGQPTASFDKWRIWLYRFGDKNAYPTGNGTFSLIQPKTSGLSTSFGNPSIAVVDRPSGNGKAIVISYTIFSEGAGVGEAGPLLYYFNL